MCQASISSLENKTLSRYVDIISTHGPIGGHCAKIMINHMLITIIIAIVKIVSLQKPEESRNENNESMLYPIKRERNIMGKPQKKQNVRCPILLVTDQRTKTSNQRDEKIERKAQNTKKGGKASGIAKVCLRTLEYRIQDSISSFFRGVSSPVIIQKAKVKLSNLTQALDYLRERNMNKEVNLGLNAD